MPRRKAMPLEDIIAIYYDDCTVQGFSPLTIRGYRRTMRCFMRWAHEAGATTLPDFTAEAVKRYIAQLQQKRKWEDNAYVPTQDKKVCATTVRNYTRDLKAFASWLEREGYTEDNVLRKVRKPKADDVPPEPFSQDELNAIFSAFDLTDSFGLRDYVMLHTLWDTGMRAGELVALTLGEVDLKLCEIRIDHAKWGKWRDIGFGKQTQKYLTRYVTSGRPDPTLDGDTHLFLSVDGYPLTVSAIYQVCRRLSKHLDIHIHPHRFRHTFAVGMLRNGTDIRTLQKLMGHSTVQMLMRYLNLADSEAIAVHKVNSPADRHHHTKQAGSRRLAMLTVRRKLA
jgi:site-specific recombinase XerD